MKKLNRPVLAWQLLILGASIAALWLWTASFPFPSPLIKDFLPPQKRWPTAQVQQWVRTDSVPRGFLSFFSRDPDRVVPSGDQVVVAPADGVIRNVTRTSEWVYIDVALSFWDVHVQRSPVKGRVLEVEQAGSRIMDGEFKNMVYRRQKMAPVQKILTLDSQQGEVKVRLITSLMARRIRVWVHAGEAVDAGQRIGRILLGSTVILQLPPDTPLAVKVGERVTAGETLIAGKEHET